MVNFKKQIFGKDYSFSCEEGMAEIVEGSIYLYPDSHAKDPAVHVKISEINRDKNYIARNPSIFTKYEDAILTTFPNCEVLWKKNKGNNSLEITLAHYKSSSIKSQYSRIRSMEYATEVELFEQVLHELVLVPSVYFFPDLSIIHAAALSINGRAILLAGTGGTGKTSAILALRKKENVGFITDDIAVVSRDGLVYPNLAWPKIYGYNLSSFIAKEEVLGNRSFLDKLHFNLKMKINPKKVRRKLRPDRLYQHVNFHPVPLDRVVYLIRDNSGKINLRDLDSSIAIEMGLHVMRTEYVIFHNHLEWDSFNSLAMGVAPILQMEQVFNNWRNNLKIVFNKVQMQSLHIPVQEKHEDYLNYINNYIVNQ